MIFDDSSDNDWNRQKVLERLAQVTLPDGLSPSMGTDWSTVGQIYWYTLRSTNPAIDVMELKSIQDWTLLKEFKSVPNIVDVTSFGGSLREYQVRLDPDKLVSYGLTIGQVEQQLSSNNVNAGGSFVQVGLQQMNVRTLGLFGTVDDIAQTMLKTQNGTALRVKDIGEVTQGSKIAIPAQPGLTTAWITRNLICHQAHHLLRRAADSQDAYWLPGAWLEFDVHSRGDLFLVDIYAADPEAANAVLTRSRAFVANRGAAPGAAAL